MTRDVLVSITGARFSEHDKEDVEMIIGGDYFWKNGKHYVLYEEVMEESGEVSGKDKLIWLSVAAAYFALMYPAASGLPMPRLYAQFLEYVLPCGQLFFGAV